MAEETFTGGSPQSHNSKTAETTATGQSLTHYHSRLYSLLSWERPRATVISFATVAGSIIAARYLPLLRWAFKFLYVSLGLTAILEVSGKAVLSRGLASSSRPRKYYTIPKDTVESVLEDLEQLVDFFLIEFQRILFAENLAYTVVAFLAAFSAYWLIRILPLWGLSLTAVTIAYMAPLAYINNRELIDDQISQLQELINSQASQVKELAGQQTAHATDVVKQYVGDYSARAHEYIGSSRAASPEMEKVPPPVVTPVTSVTPATPIESPPVQEPSAPESEFNQADFPSAPSTEPVDVKPEQSNTEPLVAL